MVWVDWDDALTVPLISEKKIHSTENDEPTTHEIPFEVNTHSQYFEAPLNIWRYYIMEYAYEEYHIQTKPKFIL